MPETAVFFYCESDGASPVFDRLSELRESQPKAFAACLAKLRMLRMFGHELRRPAADYLENGIYELRAKQGTVQYRLLYFFHGRNIAVVAHVLTKEKKVAPIDIARARERKNRYEQDLAQHRFPQRIEDLDAPP